MKKIISIFVAFALVITIFPLFVEVHASDMLIFFNQGITDEKLAEMIENGEISQEIVVLVLNSNQINDFSPLSELPNLRFIDLSYNKITDISTLSELQTLEALYLSGNQINDFSPLSELPNLRSLNLSYNEITDISMLSELHFLKKLDLSSNEITDISLLSELTNLETLDLSSNKISCNQLKSLRASLPNCEIRCNYTIGDVDINERIDINDALQILMYLSNMPQSVIFADGYAYNAACITGGDKPTINDALEILMYLAKMNGILTDLYGRKS